MSETKFTPGPWVFEDGAVYGTDFGYTVPLFDISEYEENERYRSDLSLIAAAPELYGLAVDYEEWEADVILNADWSGDLPTLTQSQWDRLIEIQGKRNAALAKARGDS